MNEENLMAVIDGFDFPGTLEDCVEIKTGHINRTYRLTFREAGGQKNFILQRINTFVFKKPIEVMENVLLVTEHLRKAIVARGLDPENRVLSVIPARDGNPLLFDAKGGAWRAYNFIDHAYSVDVVESPEQFIIVGQAFGDFQSMLSDFPIGRLHDTIPFFHDTVRRMETFETSVSRDVKHRASSVADEIAFVRARREPMSRIVRMIEAGELPLRVTHNDTKCNNVMVDEVTGEALCVVDLDTVMAGSVLYDFGDAVRIGACTAAEDERDLSKVHLDLGFFKAFAEGFVSRTARGLTAEELKHLSLGALVMTYENGMRFLTDYLDGDTYYRIEYPEHNLVRARCQFRLLTDMEAHHREMDDIVQKMKQKYQ